MSIPIKMPLDIVEGEECLDCEVPWMVPEAIYKLDEVLNENDVVIEVGMGGSTLFFARRCKYVSSFETSPEWFDKVKSLLVERKIITYIGALKVDCGVTPDETELCGIIKRMGGPRGATVFSVDTQGGYNRSAILNSFLENGVGDLRIIILDNYAHEGLFPDHWDKDNFMGDDWEVFTFLHSRWAGNGTKLLIKKQK